MRRDGVVVGHQFDDIFQFHVFCGRLQQGEQRQKYRRGSRSGFNALHALIDFCHNRCGHGVPRLMDGFQYEMAPGK